MCGVQLVTKENGEIVAKAVIDNSASYRQAIRGNIRGFWTGLFGYEQFFYNMRRDVETFLTRAWLEGAKECGITQDELTTEERLQIRTLIIEDWGFINGLAEDIEENSKDKGGKLGPLIRRADLWASRYNGTRMMGKVSACADEKLEWIRNAMDSCASCIKLEGRVYRASVWKRWGVYPQASRLACMQSAHGVPVCKCTFEKTDKKVNRGRPPNIP